MIKDKRKTEHKSANAKAFPATWLMAALIAVVTFIVFSPSLSDGFTNWDDLEYVSSNALVANDVVPVKEIFKTPIMSNYHPLTILTLAWNYQLAKLDPWGYHFWNVGIHILNTILAFIFIFLLTQRNLLMASVMALFFGIHPMHVESVTWVSERKDVLYVFFFLAGLISYLLYRGSGKMLWYFITLLLFILSCLSKGMAVVFPVILLLVDYLLNIEWKGKIIYEKIPFFLLSLVFGIVAYKIQHSGKAMVYLEMFSSFQRIEFACYGTLMYIVKFFAPVKLSSYYPYPIINTNHSIPLIYHLSPIILLGIIASVYYFFRNNKIIVFGLLFYFVSVALVLQFISVGAVVYADRYSYLAYIGLLFPVAHLVSVLWQKKNSTNSVLKYSVTVILFISVVAFSFQTYARTQVWKNSEVLWTDVLNQFPEAGLAYESIGKYYQFEKYFDHDKALKYYYEALSQYEKASQQSFYGTDSYNNIGIIEYSRKKYGAAIADLSKSIAIAPEIWSTYYNRGLAYVDTSQYENALADFTSCLRYNPTYSPAYNNRGEVYAVLHQYDLAIADYEKTLLLDPHNSSAINNLGIAHLEQGKNDLALEDFNKAIAMDPNDFRAYSNRGNAYIKMNQVDKAGQDYEMAIKLNPKLADLYLNRGIYYGSINQFDNAVAELTKYIQLKPDDDNGYNVRGGYYYKLNKFEKAYSDFSKAIELKPSMGLYWRNRSVVNNDLGKKVEANTDAIRARQLGIR